MTQARVNARSRVIVSLDFDGEANALALVEALGEDALVYKVGLELLTAAGPQIVRKLVARKKRVFLDLKLFEIPHSVVRAITVAGNLGVSMVTVHASAGTTVLQAAAAAAKPFPGLRLLAVTVITSMTTADLPAVGVQDSVQGQVKRLAQLAAAAELHGIVASAHEAQMLREHLPPAFFIATPGVQSASMQRNDQARTATAREAIKAGASHIMVGRAIAQAVDPRKAFDDLLDEVMSAE